MLKIAFRLAKFVKISYVHSAKIYIIVINFKLIYVLKNINFLRLIIYIIFNVHIIHMLTMINKYVNNATKIVNHAHHKNVIYVKIIIY